MHLSCNYLFRSYILVFYLLLISPFKSFSQSEIVTSDIKHELLTIYQKVINRPLLLKRVPCNIPDNSAVEEVLRKALMYDRQGQWQCARQIMYSFDKRRAKLSALEACHINLAWAELYTLHQSYDSAKLHCILANKEAGEQGWKNEKAQALLLLSVGELKRREISSAYGRADSALIIARQAGNVTLEGRILLQLAFCARRHFTAVAKRSFPYYLMAREKAIAAADSITLGTIDLYLSTDNFELNRWAEGLSYLKEGMTLSLSKNDFDLVCRSFTALGYCLALTAYTSEALSMYSKALVLSKQMQQPYSIQVSYHQIAETWQALKQYDSALVYADFAARVPAVDSFWANVWDLKASLYNEMGNYKMAAKMYKNSIEWFREDFLYRNQNQLSGYEAKLHTKEKEVQVAEQKKKALQLEWTIGAISGLLIISAWAFAVQRKAKRKLVLQNEVILKQRSELEQSLGEKEILLKEIHHRVKNNLTVISSLLELQSSGMEDETAKAAIAVGQNRVSSIALIHQRLYQHENLEAIELQGFLQDLFRQVSSIFKRPGTQVQMENDVQETLLDIDTAVPLGLIMNELLTNSFKYAFNDLKEGRIKIGLQQHDTGNFILTYADNGPGISEGINIKNISSLGLRLIQRLSRQLGGNAVYKYCNGSTFTICFKDSKTRNQEG